MRHYIFIAFNYYSHADYLKRKGLIFDIPARLKLLQLRTSCVITGIKRRFGKETWLKKREFTSLLIGDNV